MKKEKATAFTELETAAFCDQMALILGSGVSAYEGINIMLEESQSQEEREILNTILAELQSSGQLQQALTKAGVFPAYMLSMTAIGEESGRLDEVMAQLSLHYERQAELNASIRNTIAYPAVMTLMLAAIAAVLLTRVLPVFQQIFRQMGTEITGFSGALMQAGKGLGAASLVLLVVLLAVSVSGLVLSRSDSGRQRMVKALCRSRRARRVRDNIYAGRFADGMAIALSSGLTPDRAIELAAALVKDEEWTARINQARDKMAAGTDITDALRDAGIFSGVHSRIASIGYRTGNLEHSMERIAGLYQEETDNSINNMLATLEPTLTIILSIVVGFVLLAVMMPMLGVLAGF